MNKKKVIEVKPMLQVLDRKAETAEQYIFQLEKVKDLLKIINDNIEDCLDIFAEEAEIIDTTKLNLEQLYTINFLSFAPVLTGELSIQSMINVIGGLNEITERYIMWSNMIDERYSVDMFDDLQAFSKMKSLQKLQSFAKEINELLNGDKSTVISPEDILQQILGF